MSEAKVLDDKIGLDAYVGKDVVLQLKQPYQFQAVRVINGKPALLLFRQDNGRIVPADSRDQDAIPVAFGFILGKLRQRPTGHYFMEVADETSGSKLEVAINQELVAFVSLAVEASSILFV